MRGAWEQGSQQSQRKTFLTKLGKNKTTNTVKKNPHPLPNDHGDTDTGIYTTKSAQNHPSKVEKNKNTDTVEQDPDPLPNDYGDTETGISTTKSAQNQCSKAEKKNADIVENAVNL